MSRRPLMLGVVTAALVVAAPAAAAPAPAAAAPAMTVTATGVQLERVIPRDRHSNPSIAAAVKAAEKAGIPGALRAAHGNAVEYAAAAGLHLGAVIAITDASGTVGFFGAGGPFQGPFGINRYCGTERRPVFRMVDNKRKLVRFRTIRACIVPRSELTTLSVTYAAT